MAQYMYDSKGNRTVILSEEEEQKKQEEKLSLGCAILGVMLLYFLGTTDTGSKIYNTIKSFNDWVFWVVMFVAWLSCSSLLLSVGKISKLFLVILLFIIFLFLLWLDDRDFCKGKGYKTGSPQCEIALEHRRKINKYNSECTNKQLIVNGPEYKQCQLMLNEIKKIRW